MVPLGVLMGEAKRRKALDSTFGTDPHHHLRSLSTDELLQRYEQLNELLNDEESAIHKRYITLLKFEQAMKRLERNAK